MRFFHVTGNFEFPDEMDTETLSDEILGIADTHQGRFGGGIKEVDSDGNDLVSSSELSIVDQLKQASEAYVLMRDFEGEELTEDEYSQRQYQKYLTYNLDEIADELTELISKL